MQCGLFDLSAMPSGYAGLVVGACLTETGNMAVRLAFQLLPRHFQVVRSFTTDYVAKTLATTPETLGSLVAVPTSKALGLLRGLTTGLKLLKATG